MIFEKLSTHILHYHDKEGRTTEEQVIHKARWKEIAQAIHSTLKPYALKLPKQIMNPPDNISFFKYSAEDGFVMGWNYCLDTLKPYEVKLPPRKSAEGTQNVAVWAAVEGYNDCLDDIIKLNGGGE